MAETRPTPKAITSSKADAGKDLNVIPQFAYRTSRLFSGTITVTTLTLILTMATPSSAQVAPADRLCDNSFEDCRATVLEMIRQETAGIDVSSWFMTDWEVLGRDHQAVEGWRPRAYLARPPRQPGLCRGSVHPRVVHQRRNPDSAQGHGRHQPLEDDALQRAARRPLQRSQLLERLRTRHRKPAANISSMSTRQSISLPTRQSSRRS